MPVYNYSIPGASDKSIHIDLTCCDRQKSGPLVIFVHGFKGFKNWGTHSLVAEYFAEQGLNFLKFNFSHNGISVANSDQFDDLNGFAKNTISKELRDLNEIICFSFSGKEFAAPTHIYLIGHSLGGGISIIQTAENKAVDKLVTWASVTSFRNLWTPEQEETWKENKVLYFPNSRTNQQMPIYSTLLDDLERHFERLDIFSSARKITQPWLIIHGDQDSAVDYNLAIALHAQQTSSKLLRIRDGDHVFGAKHPWSENSLPAPLKFVCDATIAFLKNDGSPMSISNSPEE